MMPTTTVRLNASADTLHPDVQGCVHMQNNDVSPLVVLDYLIHIVHSFPSFLPHSLTPAKPIHEMTTRYPSSCLQAVSCLKRTQHGPSSTTTKTTHLAFTTALLLSTPQPRHYSFSKTAPRNNASRAPPPPKFSIQPRVPTPTRSSSKSLLNPPPTTLPPPLDLPTRGEESYPVYLYRTGRAYGTFYKDGLKNVWHNHKDASALKKRIVADLNARKPDLASPASAGKRWSKIRDEAVQRGVVKRAEFQQLERNAGDIGKLPFFGVLVLLFGEWLPLIVPFIPNRVPGTCRIPKQVRGMREKSEARRKMSFRQGVAEPKVAQVAVVEGGKWRMTDRGNVQDVLKGLKPAQLMHLSCVLNLHSGIWDKLGTMPPAALLRRAVCAKMQYLALDDFLMVEAGGPGGLSSEEVMVACEERGIDVLGKAEERLREELQAWVQKQEKDDGRGWAMVEMLFRR
jgi:hypothetical protein